MVLLASRWSYVMSYQQGSPLSPMAARFDRLEANAYCRRRASKGYLLAWVSSFHAIPVRRLIKYFVSSPPRQITSAKTRRLAEEIACHDGHDGGVMCVDMTVDGQKILSSTSTLQFGWTPKKTWRTHSLINHNSDISALRFSPDGKLVLSGRNNAATQV